MRSGREEVSFWTAFFVDWLILASLTSKEISHQPRNPDPVNVREPWLASVSQPWVCPHRFKNCSLCFLSGLCSAGHPHTALVKQCGDCWAWLSLSHRVVSNTEEESSEPNASWSLTHGGFSFYCAHVCRPSLSTQPPWWREGLALPPDSRAYVHLRARQASCWRHGSGTHGDKPVYFTISLVSREMARMTSPLT